MCFYVVLSASRTKKNLSCPQYAIFSFIESFFDLHFVLHISNQSKSLNQFNQTSLSSILFFWMNSLCPPRRLYFIQVFFEIFIIKSIKNEGISHENTRCNEMKWLNNCIIFLYENCTATFVTVQITNPMIQKAGRSVRFESLSFMANWNFSRKWDKWL